MAASRTLQVPGKAAGISFRTSTFAPGRRKWPRTTGSQSLADQREKAEALHGLAEWSLDSGAKKRGTTHEGSPPQKKKVLPSTTFSFFPLHKKQLCNQNIPAPAPIQTDSLNLLGWKIRTPATNICMVCLVRGKQRDPKKAKIKKGASSGEANKCRPAIFSLVATSQL